MSQEFSPPPFAGQDANQGQPQQAQEGQKQGKKKNAPITPEQIKFVKQNVKSMGYQEMADQLGVSRNQVNRILQQLKKGMREKVIEDAKNQGTEPYALNDKGKYDYNQPQTEMAKKVENKVKNELSRPEDTRPGAGRKGGGTVQNTLNQEVEDLLSDL